MKYLNIQETDITLTAIVDEIAANQSEVVITRNGLPVARIVPYSVSASHTKNYPLRGMPITISGDFDEPMAELWDALGE
ncbi:type II toxin-antitoxin system Phd/YefM family antitoxin [Phormidium sp. LEGE 05292]|uniref:type II toxin-antitoxin system Phd/YefM family antitoxin n=1 Tax=[Phormidium] sp. LEGE 05292 TaxID=767427 RepID=UPI00187E2BAA|nr:type II toxin-antitoxin system Phd/YefM family antitoxin [Phormidium sp. LEGE 05292]MBE9228378.1 type II toxin-antitoxin system Phd/YefM family antitoxin [Phormidium sp. LEGE 05292]